MTETAKKPAAKRERKMARMPKPDNTEVNVETGVAEQVEPPTAKPQSKAALVLEMLRRAKGATLEQIVTSTGWLPHTTRAALTGLKKKGHVTTSDKAEGQDRVYRVAAQ